MIHVTLRYCSKPIYLIIHGLVLLVLLTGKQLFNVILTSLLSSYHLIKISTQKYDICKSAPQIIEAWRAIAPVPFVWPTYPNLKKQLVLSNLNEFSSTLDDNWYKWTTIDRTVLSNARLVYHCFICSLLAGWLSTPFEHVLLIFSSWGKHYC